MGFTPKQAQVSVGDEAHPCCFSLEEVALIWPWPWPWRCVLASVLASPHKAQAPRSLQESL